MLRNILSSGFLPMAGSSAAMTGLGFFIAFIPFWIAYLPFIGALITTRRSVRFALVSGHYAIIIGIAAWGLISLGHPVWIVIAAAVAVTCALGAVFAYLGVGFATTFLFFAVPFLPGNPLLITGSLYPGLGNFGSVLLLGACCAIPYWKAPTARVAMALFLIALPSSFVWSQQGRAFLQTVGLQLDPVESPALAGFVVQAQGSRRFENPYWQLQLDLIKAEAGAQVITGENVIKASDKDTLQTICRSVAARDFDVFLGVQTVEGRAEVWKLDPEVCPNTELAYRAQVGIPAITGPVYPSLSKMLTASGLGKGAPPEMGFLACFEAFIVHRWIAMDFNHVDSVAVVSNDSWTEPLPIALLRKKVSAEFARQYNLTVAHANSQAGGAVLIKAVNVDE